jgi:CRISPR system Cascade subunit CasE
MPYLSRIWLNPLRTRAQRMLRNPQTLHAAILGAISRQPVTERVLWRLETNDRHRMNVIVLTQSRPSWEHLVEQAGWPGADEPQALVKPYEPLLDRVVRGREFAFRLKANPAQATRNPKMPSEAQRQRLAVQPRPRGARLGHRTVSHQLSWLTDRVEKWGFELLTDGEDPASVQIMARDRLTFNKGNGNGNGHQVVLQTATFEGLLRVTDPELARTSLLTGVGPGKAYGLGLITLAAPQARQDNT